MMTGDEIIALRKRLGLTQIELADKLDVAQNTVSDWECGKKSPRRTTLIDLYTLRAMRKRRRKSNGKASA